ERPRRETPAPGAPAFTETPVTQARYTGTRARTHGEASDERPAANANPKLTGEPTVRPIAWPPKRKPWGRPRTFPRRKLPAGAREPGVQAHYRWARLGPSTRGRPAETLGLRSRAGRSRRGSTGSPGSRGRPGCAGRRSGDRAGSG